MEWVFSMEVHFGRHLAPFIAEAQNPKVLGRIFR